MISSDKSYPFGGKVTTVQTPSFNCMISTAKEGIFQKQSVVFFDINFGMENRQPIAKLAYNDALSKEHRLQMHDVIVKMIDKSSMDGVSLLQTLETLFEVFQREGSGIGVIDSVRIENPVEKISISCPYCDASLKAIPGKKNRCPNPRCRRILEV